MTGRPFRFGVVAAQAGSGEEWAARARRIESMGFQVLGMPDGLRYTLAPLPALAAAAAATRSLRITTYVLANDYRNPVMLAKEAATLDLLSDGRFELGLGVGRPAAAEDTGMMGIPFEAGTVRVARLQAALRVIKSLLSGQKASATDHGYAIAEAQISPLPAQRPHLSILVAGARRRLLQLAAQEADIIALGITPTAGEATVAEMVGWIREAAGPRFADIELNINLMAVGDQVPRYVAGQMHLSAADLAAAGAASAVVGSTQAMCDTLERRRESLGISYLMVSDELIEGLAPVVEQLSGR